MDKEALQAEITKAEKQHSDVRWIMNEPHVRINWRMQAEGKKALARIEARLARLKAQLDSLYPIP